MSDEVLESYRVPGILITYGNLSGKAQRAYRDEVVAVYTQAIDARFYQFGANLGSDSKSAGLGFDSLLVGLVGAAALSSKSANEIAAVTTGVLGLRSSVDKNLFFDRTLPALISAMEAERYKVRTAIAQHIRLDTQAYPLAAALVELQVYQQAGTLLAAVSNLTSQASEAREEAKQDYEQLTAFNCSSEDDVNLAINPVGSFLRKLSAAADAEEDTGGTAELNRMRRVADAFGISGVGTMKREQLDLALDNAMIGGFCSIDEIATLKAKLRNANVNFTAN